VEQEKPITDDGQGKKVCPSRGKAKNIAPKAIPSDVAKEHRDDDAELYPLPGIHEEREELRKGIEHVLRVSVHGKTSAEMRRETKRGKSLTNEVPLSCEELWEKEEIVVTDEGIGEIECPEHDPDEGNERENPKPGEEAECSLKHCGQYTAPNAY
jgi:hypothetical protein